MYVVYTVDKTNEDENITSSERNGSITFIDPESIDVHKTGIENCKTRSSPVCSSIRPDKCGSYWSKREICCCLYSCSVTFIAIILISLIVLDLRQDGHSYNVLIDKQLCTNGKHVPSTSTKSETKVFHYYFIIMNYNLYSVKIYDSAINYITSYTSTEKL